LSYDHIKSAQNPELFCSFVFQTLADTLFISGVQSSITHSLLPALCTDATDVVLDPARRGLYPLEGCSVNPDRPHLLIFHGMAVQQFVDYAIKFTATVSTVVNTTSWSVELPLSYESGRNREGLSAFLYIDTRTKKPTNILKIIKIPSFIRIDTPT
jgi:hypothetical protein